MHVVVTGAAGFVGQGLARRLIAERSLHGQAIERLTLVDRGGDHEAVPPWVRWMSADFGDAAALDAICSTPVDQLYHLASVPGALAERDDSLGWHVNLLATQALLRRLVVDGQTRGRAPGVVFASSVAVYGALGSQPMNEHARPRPVLSYGSHKLVCEWLLEDLSRRGELDAVSLRLPGIVARPPAESGHGSAFMSQLLWRLARAQPYECPVSAAATAWWMSLPVCIDNLLHAASLSAASKAQARTWQLPVLQRSVADIVEAAAQTYGDDRRGLLSHRPDPRLEALFGRMPPLHAPDAEAAGFRADSDTRALIHAAVSGPGLSP